MSNVIPLKPKPKKKEAPKSKQRKLQEALDKYGSHSPNPNNTD